MLFLCSNTITVYDNQVAFKPECKIWHLKNHIKNMHYTVYTQFSDAISEAFLYDCSEILNMLLMQGKTCLKQNSIKWTVYQWQTQPHINQYLQKALRQQ